MRYLLTFAYWISAMLLLSIVMTSLGYGFGRALFVATSLLPGMFCAKFFLPQALQSPRRRVVATACVVAGVVIIEWLAFMLANIYTSEYYVDALPPLFSNPVFILILLAAFVVPEELLSRYLQRIYPRDKSISFISERRKVTLSPSRILYVESNDSECLLHTADGTCYRTKTRISQWEQLLDDRFVRVHRAYLLNIDHVTSVGGSVAEIGEQRFELSRKYKCEALRRFAGCKEALALESREQ